MFTDCFSLALKMFKNLITAGIHGEEKEVTLTDLLVFATGAATIPPLGFSPQPMMEFLHPGDEEYEAQKDMPTSNTCALILRIPILRDYEDLKEVMVNALEMCTTFTNN